MKIDLLFGKGNFWVGTHWNSATRQLGVNLLPCVTLRITLAPKIIVASYKPRVKFVDQYGAECKFSLSFEDHLQVRGEDVYLNGEQVINIRAVRAE